MTLYAGVALVMFVAMTKANSALPVWGALAVNTLLILLFTAMIVKRDMPLSSLPVIGKHFRKN